MIGILATQLLAVLGALVLLNLPGWAMSRLLELHLRVPVIAMPAVHMTLGLAGWTLLCIPVLLLHQPMRVQLGAWLAITAVLLAGAWWRERVRGHARVGTDGRCGWTYVVLGLVGVAALALRTRLAFDSLFHLGLIRRMLELPDPGFENLDRVLGAGVNPAYALPSWQSALAGIAAITRLDPATVLEAMAVVAVLAACCAAAGIGRAVTGTAAGEVTAAAMYAWMRVFFPRRELEGDGIAYAAVPGNVSLDVLLVLALMSAVLIARRVPGERGSRSLGLLGVASVALLVVLHANYLVYLAIIGAGIAAWLLIGGPWSRAVAARLGAAATPLLLGGAVTMAILLPVLMSLEHFGAGVEDARIDYHLMRVGGVEIIRPGHLYDWFGVPGLLGVLLLPWAAWRSRGVVRALVGGGSLAILAVALVPPLLDLVNATGSLTLGLRLARPFGILLVVAAAIAVPDIVGRVLARAAGQRGVRSWIIVALPLLAAAALATAYGYPLVRRDPPDYGWNWPSVVAVLGLLVVLVAAARTRRRAAPLAALPDTAAVAPRAIAMALLLLAACMLPSGLVSMRRAAWQATDITVAWRADDLACLEGVQQQLRTLPPGDVLLADPMTGYGAQALAPAYLVGDFKTWNGSTDAERARRRIELLDGAFDSHRPETARRAFGELVEEFDARWLLVAGGAVKLPEDSGLGSYDAIGLRELLDRGELPATLVTSGEGRRVKASGAMSSDACDLQLWRIQQGGESA